MKLVVYELLIELYVLRWFAILRLMKKQPSTQFNCFSPPVMVATVIIESILIIFTIWRYRMDTLTKLVVLCLLSLTIFQISEFNVCAETGPQAGDWARLGYVSISFLPPLGLHILHVLARKPNRKLVVAAYLTMIVVIVYFFAHGSAFTGFQCTGNYVIFQIGKIASIIYGSYYYGWLLSALYLGVRWAKELQSAHSSTTNRLRGVRAMIVGYLVFILPTALVYSVSPASRRAIPSIMCGFAILFALILTTYILPVTERRHIRN